MPASQSYWLVQHSQQLDRNRFRQHSNRDNRFRHTQIATTAPGNTRIGPTLSLIFQSVTVPFSTVRGLQCTPVLNNCLIYLFNINIFKFGSFRHNTGLHWPVSYPKFKTPCLGTMSEPNSLSSHFRYWIF